MKPICIKYHKGHFAVWGNFLNLSRDLHMLVSTQRKILAEVSRIPII